MPSEGAAESKGSGRVHSSSRRTVSSPQCDWPSCLAEFHTPTPTRASVCFELRRTSLLALATAAALAAPLGECTPALAATHGAAGHTA
eukprot:5664518-Pleurochrysis_carterae.AAC.1